MYDFNDFDYSECYEPSDVDKLVDEFREKCKEYIIPNIKDEIDRLNKENFDLKKQNDEFKKREKDIDIKERDLKYKEANLKKEVEDEFYKTNIEDTLTQYIEESQLWFANNKGFKQDKCSLCNNERKLIAKFDNGDECVKNCKCSELVYKYVPEITTIENIRFSKKDSGYRSDRKFYLSKTYVPNKNSNYGDDYSYREFGIQYVVNEFTEETKELYGDLNYGKNIGFTTKEQCKLFCEWLDGVKLKK